MNRRRLADLEIAWDAGDLPIDPFAPVLPLPADGAEAEPDLQVAPAITVRAKLAARPAPSPAQHGATPVLYHGSTCCFATEVGLVVWDGASILRIARDGRDIEAEVHTASLARVFHFSSVTVMMTLLLALRHHGLFHLHAAGARWPEGVTWLVPGESSSGKSTLALAAFAAGAQWLSDDAVLLRSSRDTLEVVGWWRMIRMTAQTAAAFPALQPLLSACPQGSARDFEVDPRRAFPGHSLAQATSPLVLLFPRIGESLESRALALDHAEAFGRVLHACAWVASEHLPQRDHQLALLARLVGAAPAFELHAGARVLQSPLAAIAEIRACLGSIAPNARA
jgi:hypothetical protein